MAQDQWTLQEKKKSQPMHGPPLQAHVVAANRTVQQLPRRTWHTWKEQGGAKLNEQNGGKNDEGSGHGMAWQRRAGTHSPQNIATAGRHSRQTICPAQASKQNSQQLAGLAANNSRR